MTICSILLCLVNRFLNTLDVLSFFVLLIIDVHIDTVMPFVSDLTKDTAELKKSLYSHAKDEFQVSHFDMDLIDR